MLSVRFALGGHIMMYAVSTWRRAALVLVAIAVVAAGCGSLSHVAAAKKPAQPTPSGLTIAHAKEIVRSYMTQEFKANLTWNVSVQQKLEAPPQVYIDDENWLLNKAAGKTAPPAPKNLASAPLEIFLPRGGNFFAAFIDNAYMIFQQEGKAYVQTYSPLTYRGAPVPDVALDKQGYATFILPSNYGKLKLTPTQLAQRYAADLETGSQGKTVADQTFAPAPTTTQTFSGLLYRRPGETASLTAKPLGDTPYAFALKGGGALVFCCVEADETHIAAPGTHYVVQKGASDGLAGVMPVGNYSKIESQGEITLAAIVPPAGSQAKVQVIAADYGPINITGQ